jgi:hypothetical protein
LFIIAGIPRSVPNSEYKWGTAAKAVTRGTQL